MFNPNFAKDGFCVDTPENDLTTVSVPVAAQYITGDPVCPPDVNKAVIEDNIMAECLIGSTEWTDGRTHSGATSIVGDNDDDFFNQLLADLKEDAAADEMVCDGSAVW